MSSESLQKWALIAEIIGGVAVVVTLAAVAYELRQSTDQSVLNTSALEIATYQDLTNSISDLNALIIESPELADIFIRSEKDRESLTENELMRFNTYIINLFRHGDMAYFQYERGAISQDRLNSVLAILTSRLSNPVVNYQWESFKRQSIFSTTYTEYVDDLAVEEQMGISDLFEKQSF